MGAPADHNRLHRAMYGVCGLSLAIGSGIRGMSGGVDGAMIPGALAAMAAVLVSGRADWHLRVAYFGLFGALGWAIGGCMGYRAELGYLRVGDPPNVLFGYAALFVIGFLWGAVGGAVTALPAYLDRERLIELLIPLALFLGILALHDLAHQALYDWLKPASTGLPGHAPPLYDRWHPLYWYRSSWSTAVIGLVAPLCYAAVRRRIDRGSALMIHLSVGWLAGFLLLPVALGVRMNPPGQEDWAGCLGLTVGLWIYASRNNLPGVLPASLVTGILGGLGLSCAAMLQMAGMRHGGATEWDAGRELAYGLVCGLGVAIAMARLARRAPVLADYPTVRRWTDWAAQAAVLVMIPWLNNRKAVADWADRHDLRTWPLVLGPGTWLDIGYAAVAMGAVWLMIRHMRRPLALVPATWLGKGQALYLMLLWSAVAADLAGKAHRFGSEELIPGGIIVIGAAILTVAVCSQRERARPAPPPDVEGQGGLVLPWVVIGVPACILAIMVNWMITDALYGVKSSCWCGKPYPRFRPIGLGRVQGSSDGRPRPTPRATAPGR